MILLPDAEAPSMSQVLLLTVDPTAAPTPELWVEGSVSAVVTILLLDMAF
jgi:hypothetical protein